MPATIQRYFYRWTAPRTWYRCFFARRAVWAELGPPLPKNYLNSQLHRRVGSRLILQLFVLGFSVADGNLYSNRVAGRSAD
jgi:hypothetical protein